MLYYLNVINGIIDSPEILELLRLVCLRPGLRVTAKNHVKYGPSVFFVLYICITYRPIRYIINKVLYEM